MIAKLNPKTLRWGDSSNDKGHKFSGPFAMGFWWINGILHRLYGLQYQKGFFVVNDKPLGKFKLMGF